MSFAGMIDSCGKLGPPTIVVVGKPGESRCSTSEPATLSALLALFALLVRKRRG
jgi:uncharacterized protein (TIGR03382 family)